MESIPCVLIVDDEESIRFFLSEEIEAAGYRALTAGSGEEALVRLKTNAVDLVLLDLMMPGMNGLQLMAEIKSLPHAPELIMLTAHASLDSAIDVMRKGGLDYLRKPCSTEELLASIERGLFQRRQNQSQAALRDLIQEAARQLQTSYEPAKPTTSMTSVLSLRGLRLDRSQESVLINGKKLSLTPTEYKLLVHLVERVDQPVSCRDLASLIYGRRSGDWEEAEARQALTTHMWRLRHKLGTAPDGGPYIINIRGKPFKFIGIWS